ncbi:MAG: hypothetical protein ACR2LF_06930 [Jatrophihabitantaceae bacterium]
MSGDVALTVSGSPSAEEVAVVLAALSRPRTGTTDEPSGYEKWRRARLAALSRLSR